MAEPLVSIIIPAYNAEKHLAEAVESALDQTWPNKEIIVVDDGSTDKTLQVALGYEQFGIKILSQANKGASAARNNGLSNATGDYIQFLDADDILGSTKIANQVTLLQQSPGKMAVCSTVHFKDGSNYLDHQPSEYEEGFLNDSEPLPFLINLWGGNDNKGSMIQPNAWLTPKAVIDKAGRWDEALTLDDDGEFFCRAVLASKGIVVARNTYNYYRKNAGKSLSGKKDLKSLQSLYGSISLRRQHLQSFESELTNKTISRLLGSLLMLCYPQYKELSAQIVSDIRQLGGFNGLPILGGRAIELIKGILGWKTARNVQYYYAQLFRN